MLVICNGMLRSGSTLQYNLAADILSLRKPLNRCGFHGGLGDGVKQSWLASLRDSDDWHVVKTHEAPLDAWFYDDRVFPAFSWRDLRDIAASIRKKWNKPFDEIVADLAGMVEVEKKTLALPRVLVQPYQRLFSQLPEAVDELAGFLEVELSAADAAAIVDRNSVSSARTHMQKGSFSHLLRKITGHSTYDSKTLLHADHISKSGGRDGDWRNVFCEQEIRQLNTRFAAWLETHGLEAN
jgi:hypothetical protein